jgi:hypothetical protein
MAVSKELKTFNMYDMFEPLNANRLLDEEKLKASTSLIFLKEKQNGNLKARSCANGSVQGEHVEAVVPTAVVVLESVEFVTLTTDSTEKQKVATIYISGTFLHANNDNYVVVKMNGSLAGMMA